MSAGGVTATFGVPPIRYSLINSVQVDRPRLVRGGGRGRDDHPATDTGHSAYRGGRQSILWRKRASWTAVTK